MITGVKVKYHGPDQQDWTKTTKLKHIKKECEVKVGNEIEIRETKDKIQLVVTDLKKKSSEYKLVWEKHNNKWKLKKCADKHISSKQFGDIVFILSDTDWKKLGLENVGKRVKKLFS